MEHGSSACSGGYFLRMRYLWGLVFLEEIQHLNINEQQQDGWVWLSESTEVYTVSSAYQLLDRESRDENM